MHEYVIEPDDQVMVESGQRINPDIVLSGAAPRK